MWKLYEQILGAPDTPMYSTFLADGRGIPDRVGLAKVLDATEKVIAVSPEGAGKKLMFFPGQVKLFADGAIISQLMQMKDGYTDGHKGEWLMAPEQLEEVGPSFIGTRATSFTSTSTAISGWMRSWTRSSAA